MAPQQAVGQPRLSRVGPASQHEPRLAAVLRQQRLHVLHGRQVAGFKGVRGEGRLRGPGPGADGVQRLLEGLPWPPDVHRCGSQLGGHGLDPGRVHAKPRQPALQEAVGDGFRVVFVPGDLRLPNAQVGRQGRLRDACVFSPLPDIHRAPTVVGAVIRPRSYHDTGPIRCNRA